MALQRQDRHHLGTSSPSCAFDPSGCCGGDDDASTRDCERCELCRARLHLLLTAKPEEAQKRCMRSSSTSSFLADQVLPQIICGALSSWSQDRISLNKSLVGRIVRRLDESNPYQPWMYCQSLKPDAKTRFEPDQLPTYSGRLTKDTRKAFAMINNDMCSNERMPAG